MTNLPVTPSQQHSKSIDDPEYWENILRDAGLPSEPPQPHQLSALPSDSRNDFGDQTTFFDKYSHDIFEAKQQWKKVGDIPLVCEFCECKFYDRVGTKFCCPSHRKRHGEGKVYVKVMCEQLGCSNEIPWWIEPTKVDGKNFCWPCTQYHKCGCKNQEEYLARYEAKHDKYLDTRQRQAEQERKMRLGEL
ncbi:MAG: hypothetical protein WBM24_08610 [Candidatus Sulfotelmatobacter sp.]